MKKKTTQTQPSKKQLLIKAPQQSTVTLKIRSLGPMIQHRWSEKSKAMLRMSAIERKKQPKISRDPEKLAREACYFTAQGEHGINALSVKKAIISAAHKDLGIEKTLVRKALFINCDDPGHVISMECEPYKVREDIVKVGTNQTDLRYRPEFASWSCVITFTLDSELMSEQDLVNLIDRAGFSAGIGEWRPEKDGEHGRFQVDTTYPISVT